jgi:hypothetical protein
LKAHEGLLRLNTAPNPIGSNLCGAHRCYSIDRYRTEISEPPARLLTTTGVSCCPCVASSTLGRVPGTWISDEMRAAIGREYGTSHQSVPISLSDIRRWALAIYYPEAPPRMFWDEDAAASGPHGGIVAPEEFNPFAWFTAEGPVLPPTFEGQVRGSGTEEALGIEAPETSFILNGGLELIHGARMRRHHLRAHEADRVPRAANPPGLDADHDHRDAMDEPER